MKYRRKPVEAEIWRLGDDPERIAPEWFAKEVAEERIIIDRCLKDGAVKVYGCTVRTLFGNLHARIGDCIARNPDGSLQVFKNRDIRTYFTKVEKG